jgi:signal transduction histidine kinase/HPt (histidine-containing phosphotransfer) domain-containing protein/ActR/RegA family two-component response regulator
VGDDGELERLRTENAKLTKINRALMSRVERSLDQGSPFALFESATSLESEVRQRTAALRSAMRELSTTNEELRAATFAADAANRAKSEFIARISHELRTPMNGVLGMTELLLESQLSPAQRRSVHTIGRSAQLLLRVIDDVLDFTKAEQGKLRLEQRSFELAPVMDDTLDLLAETARRRGIELMRSIDPELPRAMIGDSLRLRQMLTNLVGNAIKFTPKGHVAVRFRQRAREGDAIELELEVEDTGIGIEPAAQRAIFDAFTQADGSTTRRYGGTGLGLAIVRQLAEMMDGSVTVRSEPGAGSTFTIVLRMVASTRAPVEVIATEQVRLAEHRGLHVLVAEDNGINVEVLQGMLERLGCTCEVAGDGRAAVQAAASGRFDAILMDWQMPVLDGLAASRQIREHERAQALPPATIIAVTSNAMPADRERCLAAGMDSFLSKPLTLSALAAALPGGPRPRCEAVREEGPLELGALLDLAQLDDDGAMITRVLQLFVDECPRALDRLCEASRGEDLGRVADESHRLRSSCGYVGARKMVSLCEDLERAGRGGAADRVPALLDALAAAFEQVRVSLPCARLEALRRTSATAATGSSTAAAGGLSR